MLNRPTTEQVLRGLINELTTVIAPELHSEPAKVSLGMITQILNGCATRSAHEIEWIHDECNAIESAVSGLDDPATQCALADYRNADLALSLDASVHRYHLASEALSAAIEFAFSTTNKGLVVDLRELLKARSAHEMQILGVFEMVGRG